MIVDGTMEVEPFGNLAFVIYGKDASLQDGRWSLWGAIIDAADVENWDGENERRECYCIHPGDIGLELEGVINDFQFPIPAGGDTLHTIRERLEHIQCEGGATDGTIETQRRERLDELLRETAPYFEGLRDFSKRVKAGFESGEEENDERT